MHADELDDRIRSLVRDAVAAAPAAPELSNQAPTAPPLAAAPSRGRGWVWSGIGIAASVIAIGVLVMTDRDDDPSIVAGSTSTDAASTSVVGTALPWPDGAAVIVASGRGIEKVTAENGEAVVTRLLSGVSVARAFELEDGTIVYQTAPDGIVHILGREDEEPLATGVTLDDADAPDDNLRLVYRSAADSPTSATRVNSWFQPDQPVWSEPPGGFGVGYRRFTIVDRNALTTATMDDTGQRGGYLVPVNPVEVLLNYGLDAATTTPFQQVGDGSGSVGVLDDKGQFVSYGTRSGFTANLGDPTAVTEVDFRGQWLAVQRDRSASSLVDLVSGTAYELPIGDGVISVSRRDRVDTQPVSTTVVSPSTSEQPTPTTVLPVGLPAMVTTGPNGVWEYGSGQPVQWSTEAMAFAVKAPDGSVIVQRRAGNGESNGWTIADTLPLRIASPGATPTDLFDEFFAAADLVAGWWTIHDAATVDGSRPLLLLDRQVPQSSGIDTPTGSLMVLNLAAGTLDEVGRVGGWEEGVSRLHLSETGLVVGERYSGVSRSLFALSLNGGAVPTADGLGLQDSYDDCGDCPRLYTVSRSGRIIAWLDGTSLVRVAVGEDIALPQLDLGELAAAASDLSIAGDQVVFDRRTSPSAATSVRATIDGERAVTEVLAEPTRTALI